MYKQHQESLLREKEGGLSELQKYQEECFRLSEELEQMKIDKERVDFALAEKQKEL